MTIEQKELVDSLLEAVKLLREGSEGRQEQIDLLIRQQAESAAQQHELLAQAEAIINGQEVGEA